MPSPPSPHAHTPSPTNPQLAVKDKLLTLGGLLAVGGGYAAWSKLPIDQALNGFISVLMFNIIYDLLLR